MKRFIPLIGTFATAALLVATSCSKVDCVYPDSQEWEDCEQVIVIPDPIDTNDTIDTTDTTDTTITPVVVNTKRNVLVEEFTGPGCGNCPESSDFLLNLAKNTYPERVVVVGMHAGWFSSGLGNNTGFDLSCSAAESYYVDFNVTSNPIAMINRKSISQDEAQLLIGDGNWKTAIENYVIAAPDADMTIAPTISYDGASREVDISATIEVVNALDGDFRFVAYVLEDNIVGRQYDYRNEPPVPELVEDYNHRHVMRDAITSIYGDFVFEGNATSGATATVSVNDYSLDSSWDVDNCSVVFYVYNDATNEVIQVEEVFIR